MWVKTPDGCLYNLAAAKAVYVRGDCVAVEFVDVDGALDIFEAKHTDAADDALDRIGAGLNSRSGLIVL
jgi:hypothetical protein